MKRTVLAVAAASTGLLGCAPHDTTPADTPTPVTTTTTTAPPQATYVPPVADTSRVEPIVVNAVAIPLALPATTTPPWTGDLPEHYGTGSGCTRDQATIVADAMRAEGATDDSVTWMLLTISRESTCDPAAHNGNRNTGDDSWGLCQINNLAGFYNPDGILADYDRYAFATSFELNAEACARLWAVCGRGPWTKGDYGCRPPQEIS